MTRLKLNSSDPIHTLLAVAALAYHTSTPRRETTRKETLKQFLSSALTPRILIVLLAVLVVLMLLTILILPHMHLGIPHMLVQSTESILD